MKILYHHRIGSKDGQYVHVSELQRAMRELGHDLVVVEPKQFSGRKFGADSGLAGTLRGRVPKVVHESLELMYALLDYARLRESIVRYRPQCIYERYNLFTPSGAWAKRRLRLPLVVEVNAPLYRERSAFGGIALHRIARWSESLVWRSADYVLPVTDVLADYVARTGVPRSRIVTIPNGVNLDEYRISPETAHRSRRELDVDGKLVLGFTGFVREWHGLDRAVDVIADQRHRDELHLLVVGDGPGCESIRRKAQDLGVSSCVTVTGIVERADVPKLVAAFDVALQPNVVEYASPLKIFEYLAMGKAIVAPDVPNIREILTDQKNALLFDPDDRDALARSILRLADDRGLRERLGEAARALIDERSLTWHHNAVRVSALLQELVGP